ncbi:MULTISPECIES: Atxe2 family lasso peptide isopeptidase [unclassified Novosphingobium]|uniref:Atxe2 family lasso peptide isopeptidase n=1 Tax=unclassified Novosphingobium TaxID=2644732 RepID=UPI001AC92D76|nr:MULTISPECIES: Atxe2 family lasso peptide isopeptidase [unclassified Novosphingobium]MBN9145673.1 Atxe2 family lasso peptide isopeptidase [Novosphingobium sp.]
MTPDDLLELRDIGQPDSALFEAQSPLAISPDGKRLAFVMTRADPEANSQCRALVVIDLAGGREPQALDRGGEFPIMKAPQRGVLYRLGLPVTVTPVWSPDGRWIAYLRRDHGTTQLWRARSDGSGAQVMTHSAVDIEDFTWSPEQRRWIFAATPGLREAARQIDREGNSGWLNDVRMVPNVGARPLLPATLKREVFALNLESRPESGPENWKIEAASEAERALLKARDTALPSARFAEGRRAWAEHLTPNPYSGLRLLAEDRAGKTVICRSEDCSGSLSNIWWEAGGRSLIFLRREGWNRGQMGLFRWVPGQSKPRRILLTGDLLHGCVLAVAALICTSENAVMPRRIVSISLRDGAQRLIFDPNPEFGHLRLGTVTRLTWRNDKSLPAWGDLVLPPDYRPGTRLPMIITQYHSDGFLRGATGDEYPIHAFAARGFAVLSLERPPLFGSDRSDLRNWEEVFAASIKDWADRRSLLSSMVTGIDQVIARGFVDPARIGITGLSDGASEARFALVNTRLFAAAAISSCCTDTNAMMNAGGSGFADAMHAAGYPKTIEDNRAFWAPYSMALSARRMDRPLLMQLADSEMGLGLETFTALREAGQPVEMYVFPDETHNKWQPAHRKAIYQRNLDWFGFWLQGKVDPDPTKTSQYERWQAMKAALLAKGVTP